MAKDIFNDYTQLNMTAYAAVWCGSFTVLEWSKKNQKKEEEEVRNNTDYLPVFRDG